MPRRMGTNGMFCSPYFISETEDKDLKKVNINYLDEQISVLAHPMIRQHITTKLILVLSLCCYSLLIQ